jgi:hypothetical protein
LVQQGVPDISHLLPELLSAPTITFLKRELPNKWNQSLDLSAKIQLAKKIVKGAKKAEGRKEEDEDEDEDEAEEVMWKGKKPSTRTTIMMTVSSSSTRPWTTSTIPSRTTTAQTRWAIARQQQQQQRWSSFVQRGKKEGNWGNGRKKN